jgi:hypothetical protein
MKQQTSLALDTATMEALDKLQGRLLADFRVRASRPALIQEAVKLLAVEATKNVELLAYRLRSA